MSVSFIMVLAMGVLFAAGIYLMLERSLTRVLLGFILLGNGVNLLIILTAGRGSPPLTDGKNLSTEGMSDPLPHALILTAIVITFGVSAFLLAIIYRSWRLVRQEVVGVDEEDRRVARRSGMDADEIDPDDLAPEDRPAGHADSLQVDPEAEALLERHYPGIPSDDVDLRLPPVPQRQCGNVQRHGRRHR